MQGVRALKVEYEELPFVLDVQKAMEPDAPQIHENYPGNILKHTDIRKGDYAAAIQEPGLVKVEGWYETPTVQHCHIENHGCYAYEENGRVVVVSSTQIPHIIRRIVGQALGLPVGGCPRSSSPISAAASATSRTPCMSPFAPGAPRRSAAAVSGSTAPGRRPLFPTASATPSGSISSPGSGRTASWPPGRWSASPIREPMPPTATPSCAKAMGSFAQIYPCDHMECDGWTVFTNRPAAGAMRGYGMPQASFADEANIDECAAAVGMEPLEYRMKFIMPKDFHDAFSGNTNYFDSFRACLEKGRDAMDYDRRKAEFAKDTGSVRRGIGAASFWYNTGVYPISLETASNRMQLNLDGTVTMQCGETEIGQGADTAYAQMTAKAVGLKSYKDVHVVSCQDTDITPTGLGAYASRQTYMEGFAIDQTGRLLRQKILAYAAEMLGCSAEELDIVEGNVVRKDSGAAEMDLSHLAMTAQYNPVHSEHITAESTATIRSNAYSFGCTFAEVEVDIPMCKVTLKRIINVHDCGSLINPALAEAQVHGGMSMGIGYGLSEQLLFDEKTGKPLNNNLLDYKLSTVMDHPDLEALFVENAEPTSPFGTKALGEPPACSPAPAIRSAIYNATGVSIDTTPITPHVLYRAFKEAGLIHDEKEGD